MALTIWLTLGAVVWLVLWSLGAKPIDSGLLGLLILVIGATMHILRRYLPNRGQ